MCHLGVADAERRLETQLRDERGHADRVTHDIEVKAGDAPLQEVPALRQRPLNADLAHVLWAANQGVLSSLMRTTTRSRSGAAASHCATVMRAGLLAAAIVGNHDAAVRARLLEFRRRQTEAVAEEPSR